MRECIFRETASRYDCSCRCCRSLRRDGRDAYFDDQRFDYEHFERSGFDDDVCGGANDN